MLIKACRLINSKQKLDMVSDILIKDGIVVKIGQNLTDHSDIVIDGGGRLVLMCGFFDIHVHLRDPGFTYKEDIITGTKAAAAGGFTAVACMPNTKPCIDSPETIKYILDKASGTGVKVYPVACVTSDMKGAKLCDFNSLKRAGAIAISDDGRPVENAELLRQALESSKENGLTVISHCEDLAIINGGIINKGKVSEKLNVKGMDRASEDSITAREIALAMSCDAHIHIAHVSTAGSIQFIRDAKRAGHKVTCETAPHYFKYTDELLLKRDADYRMNPPLREESDRLAIIEGILDGTVDCVVTDHAPHSQEEKADFLNAPNGVIGLETSLSVTLTDLYHTKKISLARVSELMAENPYQVLGLDVPSLNVGEVADFVIFDPDFEWVVNPDEMMSKSKNTVFKGEKLKGKVMFTISNGRIIFNNN